MRAYSLDMKGKSEFDTVSLREAKISGRLSMVGSSFKSELNMKSASIGGNLDMKSIDRLNLKTKFAKVDLSEAKVGGHLTIVGSTFKADLDMHSATIGRSLFMRDAQFAHRAILASISVTSRLDARGAKLSVLDLTKARIEGELLLGPSSDRKKDISRLELRNTSVGVLQDNKDAWPEHLELDGFTYKRFGAGGKEAPEKRGSDWFVTWLAKDKTYSPQPYRHLASVLRDSGLSDMADDILYANQESLRVDYRTSWGRWLLLSGLKMTIGYGLRYFQILGWVGVFRRARRRHPPYS